MIEKNSVILITGGVRGIGAEIARKFSQHETKIILWDINDLGFDLLKEEIDKYGSSVEYFKVDVSNYAEVEKNVNLILEKYSKIDVLINNAGITKDNLLLRMNEQEWDAVINVNLKGTFNCTKNVISSMIKAKRGSIINISSIIGIMGNKGQCNYSASKAGIIGFTKSIAKELGQRNIRVNAIAPGFIETEMTKKLPEEIINEYSKLIPLKRMGRPEDVADLCVFLASSMSAYITGQVINCDGGMLM